MSEQDESEPRFDPLRLDTLAFLLLLAVLPLVSYGATREIEALWMLGLVLLAVGALIPLVTEFGLREDEEEDEAEEADEDTKDETVEDSGDETEDDAEDETEEDAESENEGTGEDETDGSVDKTEPEKDEDEKTEQA